MSRCHNYLLIGKPPAARLTGGTPGSPGSPRGLKAAGLPAKANWESTEPAPLLTGGLCDNKCPGNAPVGGKSPGNPGNIIPEGAIGPEPDRSNAAAAAAAAAAENIPADVGTAEETGIFKLLPLICSGFLGLLISGL